MEALQFKRVGLLCPNPTGKRAIRTKWDLSPAEGDNRVAYGC